jgi:hypothetical protein
MSKTAPCRRGVASTSSTAASTVLLAFALVLRPSAALAQSRNLDDYVLLATNSISATGLSVTGGDIGVLDGVFASSRGLVAPSSVIGAPSARLETTAVCGDLFTSSIRGGGATCGATAHAFSRPFSTIAQACGFPDPFPDCEPPRPPLIVANGATVALPPGVYGDVRVEGGPGGSGTLLVSGSYGICNLRVGRGAKVEFTGPSTLLVARDLTASTAARLEPAPGAGLSPIRVNVFVAGTLLRLTRRASMALRLCAPSAGLRLGSRAVLSGRFVAATMRFRHNTVSLVDTILG